MMILLISFLLTTLSFAVGGWLGSLVKVSDDKDDCFN